MSAEEQAKEPCRKPCVECPFRRGTKHNGGSPPEVYVGQAMGPFLLACHMTASYKKNPRDPANLQCAGAAIYRANVGRDSVMPPSMLRLPKDTEAVFGTHAEMIAHHWDVPIELVNFALKMQPPEALLEQALRSAGCEFVDPNKVTDGQ